VIRLAALTLVAALVVAPTAGAADQQIVAATNAQAFTPAEVTVGIGDTVTVSRASGGFEAHNSRYNDMAKGCPESPMATAWSCPRTFGSAGDFTFHCELHTTMQATVHVIGGPLPPPAPTPIPTPGPPKPSQRRVPIQRLATLPRADGCLERDSLRLRLKRVVGSVVIDEARVFVGGRRVAVRRGDRLTVPVVAGRLPEGRFAVRVQATASNGDRLSGSRRYRTCPED
jgi:plastocyanin